MPTKTTKIVFSAIGLLVFFALTPTKNANAAPCPVGGSQTLSASCEMPAIANYTDLTIPAGIVVTSTVGQKMQINATGTVTITAGGGIDVSGKGNNTAGQGAGSTSTGSSCTGSLAGGGGGGGYGGAGGAGAADIVAGGAGGSVYGSNTSPEQLGSAGAPGGGNSGGNGMGGGAVKIAAGNIILNGYIRANGTNGSDPRGNDGSGGGGGGSGGSIWLMASNSFSFAGGNLEARGGSGGTDVNCGGWDGAGGGGGGGRISLQYSGPKIGAGTHSVIKGAGGGGNLSASAGADGTFYEDPCYQKVCDNYCGGANKMTGYSSGSCDTNTGVCNFTTIKNCADTNDCTLDTCEAGVCGNTNLCGGLVPCGRLIKGSDPNIDMTKPCDLCSAMYMLKKMLNFTMEIATGIAIFIIIIGGLLYAFSAGNPKNTEKAKSAITYAITGLVIIFIAWLIVAIILNAMGYADITHWNQVNCTLQK